MRLIFALAFIATTTVSAAFEDARHVQKASPAQVRTQDSISSLPNDIGSNPFKAADERALEAAYTPSTCDEANFVDCENGFVRDSNSEETCAEACDGNCCESTDGTFSDACVGFTGKVCKDGSCKGTNACIYAVIPEVINSCKKWGTSQSGDNSCYWAGRTDSSVGKMVDSCLGEKACLSLGRYGEVGDLTNSCHSVNPVYGVWGVCQYLGLGGSVGNVTFSCYGSQTCYELGEQGVVGPVTNSCGSQVNGASVEDTDYQVMGDRNCYRVDKDDGANNSPISSITDSCRDGSCSNQCAEAKTDAELIGKDSPCPVLTNSPSKEPTNSPSKAPTNSPSKEPTSPPTVAIAASTTSSWSLGHDAENSGANFTSGTGDEGEVKSAWNLQGPDLAGEPDINNKSYTLKTIIKKGFCSGSTTAVDAVAVASDMVSGGLIDQAKVDAKGVGLTPTCIKDVTSDGSTASKECVYEFDKSSMNSVVGYDAATGVQKLCEIAQLQWSNMVIMEQYMNVQMTFNRTAGFTVSDIAMSAATIESSTADTSLADYITAAQCDAGYGTGSIAPNQELCVKIESSSPDVLIKSVDEMTMTEVDSSGVVTDATLGVISSSNVATYPAITSINGSGEQTVTIKSMVPTSEFNFEDGGSLKITGSVTVKFADGRRRLISLDRLLQANEDVNEAESAAFDLDVEFARGPDAALEDGDAAMMNSAKATAGKAFATLGMAFAFAFALW